MSAIRWIPLLFLPIPMVCCGPAHNMKSVPEESVAKAQIPDMPHIRTWGDDVEDHFLQSLTDSLAQESTYFKNNKDKTHSPTVDILALSGGGEHGAFGAGLLCGWSDRGDRPEFKLITGVSTGALTAPLAFIGDEGDHMLRTVYTRVTKKDILEVRNLFTILVHDAIAQTTPLSELVEEVITPDTLKLIANEHEKGRRLLIATVNLEAQRPVIWNMGVIAASGHPNSLELFRKVMVASASIPGAFEPQYFKVKVGEKIYEEMHVDGGTAAQVFLWGAGVTIKDLTDRADISSAPRPVRLFVIRNARIEPEHKYMRSLFVDIAGRAVSTLIKSQGLGDIHRIYTISKENNMDFHLLSIPSSFKKLPKEQFDQTYMNQLFEFAYRNALAGTKWQRNAPFYQVRYSKSPSKE